MLKAKVVAYTQAVDSRLKDANELIAYIARVSNPDNQHNNLSAPKLISYLQRHKHWSPFEHYSLTIEIECPKDIAVQILRHRSFKFQEFSQRYADVTQMGFTTRECRLQDTNNRQNSIELDINEWSDRNLQQEWSVMQEQLLSYAKDYYQSYEAGEDYDDVFENKEELAEKPAAPKSKIDYSGISDDEEEIEKPVLTNESHDSAEVYDSEEREVLGKELGTGSKRDDYLF